MKEIIAKEISKISKVDEKVILNLIAIPPSTEMGDFAFPCFSLAKDFRKNPSEIAKELSENIKNIEFEKVEAKGPYVNFFINKRDAIKNIVLKILKEKEKFGSLKKRKETVMIEFSQANTHKAFHVGHIRGTSIGESLSRILEFRGSKVIRANYQGDTGMHVAKWMWCYTKYHSKESLKKDESWIASIYVDAVKRLNEDEALQEEVNSLNKKLEEGKDKELLRLWKKTRTLCLNALDNIYKELNTHFDRFYFEREVELSGKKIAQDLIKKGIAKVSDGATIMDLNEFGLSVWVLLRKDGTVLYSSKDLSLAEKKFKEFSLDKSINIVADEQNLHFKQLFKTLEIMAFKEVKKCQHIPFALVRLPEGKMSSRTGQNILYSDFMNEMKDYAKIEIEKREKLSSDELEKRALKICIAAIKYFMLKQHSNNVIVFTKEEALNFEGNTGPYLLYTYARAKSILKKARYKFSSKIALKDISDKEKNLAILLERFSEVISQSEKNLSPNLIANYAFELSQNFNEFYHSEQVIGSEGEKFKLSLVFAFSIILKQSLTLLGIETLEKM